MASLIHLKNFPEQQIALQTVNGDKIPGRSEGNCGEYSQTFVSYLENVQLLKASAFNWLR